MVSSSDQDLKCLITITSVNANAIKKKRATGVTTATSSDEATYVGGFDGTSLGREEGNDELDGCPEGTLDG